MNDRFYLCDDEHVPGERIRPHVHMDEMLAALRDYAGEGMGPVVGLPPVELKPPVQSQPLVTFKVHVHRQALHSPEKRKWWLHFGDQKVQVVDCIIRVPCQSVVDLERGDTGDVSTACAQAWLEGHVEPNDVTFSEDGTIVYVGAAA